MPTKKQVKKIYYDDKRIQGWGVLDNNGELYENMIYFNTDSDREYASSACTVLNVSVTEKNKLFRAVRCFITYTITPPKKKSTK